MSSDPRVSPRVCLTLVLPFCSEEASPLRPRAHHAFTRAPRTFRLESRTPFFLLVPQQTAPERLGADSATSPRCVTAGRDHVARRTFAGFSRNNKLDLLIQTSNQLSRLQVTCPGHVARGLRGRLAIINRCSRQGGAAGWGGASAAFPRQPGLIRGASRGRKALPGARRARGVQPPPWTGVPGSWGAGAGFWAAAQENQVSFPSAGVPAGGVAGEGPRACRALALAGRSLLVSGSLQASCGDTRNREAPASKDFLVQAFEFRERCADFL